MSVGNSSFCSTYNEQAASYFVLVHLYNFFQKQQEAQRLKEQEEIEKQKQLEIQRRQVGIKDSS